MKLNNKSIVSCLILTAVLGLVGLVKAEVLGVSPEPVAVGSSETEVTAQDLGVAAPTILPDSMFYFLKDWQRGLKLTFTFNQIKKAEVRQQIINEKLVELRALAEKTQDPAVLEKAALSSEKNIKKLKEQVDEFKDKAADNPEVDKFLDKFINQGLLQQKILEKLEDQVPPKVFERIEAARQTHMKKFGEVMSKLEDKEKIADRINNILENQADNDFKGLDNLRTLEKLEEVLPPEIKGSIKQLQERNLNEFKERIEKMLPAAQEKVSDYLEKMDGNKEKQLEILETLIQEVRSTVVQDRLEKAKEKIIQKIEQSPQKVNCPSWTSPAPGFCPEGRIIINKDSQGCRLTAKCIITGKTNGQKGNKMCIALWDPVCGSDGKTYSNKCYADNAGVSIVSDGRCDQDEEEASQDSQTSCERDLDCACGRKKDTQECFYGNRKYVDTASQCPDYCGGIIGRLRLRCVDKVCVQASE